MKNTKNYLKYVFASTVFVIGIGCNNSVSDKKPLHSFQTYDQNSCVIALSPHSGIDKSDKAIQKYQLSITKNKFNINQLENLGWAYVNKAKISFDPGFYKLAEQTVECMKLQQANSLASLLLQGHILHNLHRFKEAETIARQLVETRGYWYDHGLLGDALMEQGKLTPALFAYQEMMDQNPGPQAYNRAAYLRWLKGDVIGAIELLNLSLTSFAGQNNNHTAWTLTRIADYEFQSGHIENSQDYLSIILERQPNYAPAMLVQGRIKTVQGLKNEAIDILTRAVQINPLPEYQWELIEALSGIDQLQEKRAKLEQQLFQSGEAEDRRTYALYLATTGLDAKKAVVLAEQEMQKRHDVFTLDTLAWALRSNNQLERAKKYSKQALLEGTRSARLFYHAGVIAKETGQFQEAKQLLKQAKELEISLLPSEQKHLNQIL